jgi:hypothetical protein
MVREHEHRRVEDGVVTPPALPFLVGPRAALWSELVAAHDLGSDAGTPGAGEGIVGAGAPTRLAVHGAERAGGDEPLHEPAIGVSEGLFEGLPLTGAETVE